jgi:hypothetical protein
MTVKSWKALKFRFVNQSNILLELLDYLHTHWKLRGFVSLCTLSRDQRLQSYFANDSSCFLRLQLGAWRRKQHGQLFAAFASQPLPRKQHGGVMRAVASPAKKLRRHAGSRAGPRHIMRLVRTRGGRPRPAPLACISNGLAKGVDKSMNLASIALPRAYIHASKIHWRSLNLHKGVIWIPNSWFLIFGSINLLSCVI